MAPAHLLDAQPGRAGARPLRRAGGKTTQLAAAMQGRGLLVCNEIHPRRAQVLASNIERLGIPNALVLSEHPAKLAQRFPGYFDRILVDAPCSGEGMFRKEEAAVTDWSKATVAMCAARQQEILASAAEMLAPGGRLVYSTCTFSPEENEGVISAFLHAHPAFSVEPVRGSVVLSGAAGLDRRSRARSGARLPPLAAPSARRGPLCGRPAQPCGRRTAGCSHGTPGQAPAAAADLLRSCTQPLPDGVPSASALCAIWPRRRRPPFPACACCAPVWSLVNCAVTASPPPTRWRSGCTPTRQTADFPGRRPGDCRLSARRDAARTRAAGRC